MRRPPTRFLLASVALVACQAASPSLGSVQPGDPLPAPTSPTTSARAPWALNVHDGTGQAGPVHLSGLAHLSIDTSGQGVSGAHAVRIDVLGPTGTLYAQLGGAIVATPGGNGSLGLAMQVAGTPIELFRMVGNWQFAMAVDGAYVASATIEVVD